MGTSTTELTAELMVDSAAPRPPAISPDGSRVAYVVAQNGRAAGRTGSLWVAATDGGTAPAEAAPGTPCQGVPRWWADSASLVLPSDGQLRRIRLDGGEPEVLTAWRGEILDHLPLADGTTIAVVATDEPSEEDERRQAERGDAIVWGENVGYGRLRLLDTVTGTLRTVDGLGDRHVVDLVQRPDGGPLAVISWADPEIDPGILSAELHLVDPVDGTVRGLGRIGLNASSPAWWQGHDGWHVSYLAVTPPGPVGGLAVLDVTVSTTGAATDPAPEHHNLTEGMTACPTHLTQVADGTPLALFADGLDTALHRLDPGTPRFRQVTGYDGGVVGLTASRSGAAVAVLASTAHAPNDVHAGPPGGPLVRISDTRPELRRINWGSQERLSWKAADGLPLDGLLILPPGKRREDGPFPLVTLVHGGPDGRYADEFTNNVGTPGHWLAAAGHAVFLPNPRGGLGHGHAFAATVAGRVGLDEWTDIVSGIDLLIADGVADPDRLGIGGWSHGGFMAAWAVGQTERFAAALVGAGVSDWGMLAATGENGTLEAGLGGSVGWEGPGPHPHDRLSPISFASRIRTPVLILHGEDDTNVPLGQAVFLHRALLRFGVAHEFVVYPREGHGVGERAHQLDVLRRTRAWFGRWLADPQVSE